MFLFLTILFSVPVFGQDCANIDDKFQAQICFTAKADHATYILRYQYSEATDAHPAQKHFELRVLGDKVGLFSTTQLPISIDIEPTTKDKVMTGERSATLKVAQENARPFLVSEKETHSDEGMIHALLGQVLGYDIFKGDKTDPRSLLILEIHRQLAKTKVAQIKLLEKDGLPDPNQK